MAEGGGAAGLVAAHIATVGLSIGKLKGQLNDGVGTQAVLLACGLVDMRILQNIHVQAIHNGGVLIIGLGNRRLGGFVDIKVDGSHIAEIPFGGSVHRLRGHKGLI